MRRRHLFEFGDMPWLPRILRDGMTGYFEALARRLPLFEPAIQKLNDLLACTREHRIVDLCSGAGGPLVARRTEIRSGDGQPLSILLTDLFPNEVAWRSAATLGEGAISFAPRPVEALAVPAEMRGVRTLFSSFHHFRPDDARAILADAAERGCPIAVFELTHRSLAGMLMTMLLSPIQVLLLMPFSRPVRLGALFFTYVVPLLPLVIAWDAAISSLRSYTPEELAALAREAKPSGYAWEAGRMRIPGTAASVTFLIGAPE